MDDITLRSYLKKFADKSSEEGIALITNWAVQHHFKKHETVLKEGELYRSF